MTGGARYRGCLTLVEQQAITGVIAARAGVTPGPASAMLYTIDANMPGAGVVRLSSQRPLKAYPDTLDVIGYEPGDGVHGMLIGTPGSWRVQWNFMEPLAFGTCPNVTPGGGGGQPPPPPPPPPPTGPVGFGGGTPSPSPGPGEA